MKMLDRQTANLLARMPRWYGPAVRWSVALANRPGSMWPDFLRFAPLRACHLLARLGMLAGFHKG